VARVAGLEAGGHDPLVAGEAAARLEHPKNLAINVRRVWGVAGGLDGVRGVKVCVPKGKLQKVTLHDTRRLGQPIGPDALRATVNLEKGRVGEMEWERVRRCCAGSMPS
jgi:hypothetical protein